MEKEKQSPSTHSGEHLLLHQSPQLHVLKYILANANANSMCMEIIYSESWVTFLVIGAVMTWQQFIIFSYVWLMLTCVNSISQKPKQT